MGSSKNSNSSEEHGGCSRRTRPQDVEWLSSLSEFELDFLMSLKEMAIKRAKNVGFKDLGDKFDARILRALGAIMLEYFKGSVRSTSTFPNSAEALQLLSGCRLALPNQEANLGSTSSTKGFDTFSFVTPRQKQMWEGLCEERVSSCKKQKTADTPM